MHTRSDPAQTRYRTLYRLGYWCSLEAECRTEASAEFSELIDHQVTFVLINKFGDRCKIGYSLFTGQTDRLAVFDENGEAFPALAAAVRTHAAQLMEVTEMPGLWRDRPARYDTWQGTVATAFNAP
jgi:hypothetical protein